ncbi:hypothetical protein C7974DRAFT_185026 [Boeremia exigua]|uniref:uncharacterized protein n=1 Tax=Boeremia exigua TaxID=749465 RepID=UPI001E8E8FE0|nr:uncharacterized protein C7974DRAFT_185026 [Boeremia exigua]KAH6629354.1 hypothetical protein C7974DRAFT_185026 [Boeremia exigua]
MSRITKHVSSDGFEPVELFESHALAYQSSHYTIIPSVQPSSVRSVLSLPLSTTAELYIYLKEHPLQMHHIYHQWLSTHKLATCRVVGAPHFRADEAEWLLDLYARSYSNPASNDNRFRNTCVDAMIEVLHEYGIKDSLVGYMTVLLKGRAECGMWRLVTLYRFCMQAERGRSMFRKCVSGFEEGLERDLQKTPKGEVHEKVWGEVVRGAREKFYESDVSEQLMLVSAQP